MNAESWNTPVLDGSGAKATEGKISAEDLARCPGWSEEQIQSYLDQGWPIDKLAEYYQQQVDENQKSAQV